MISRDGGKDRIAIFHLSFQHFQNRWWLLSSIKINDKQGYAVPRFKSSLQIFYGRHHGLVDLYEISISQLTMDLLLFT